MFKEQLKKKLPLFILLFSQISMSEISNEQKMMLDSLPPDQRGSILEKMETASDLEKELEETFESESPMIKKSELRNIKDSELYCETCIYGYNFFQYSPTTFAPVSRTPITANYLLGPGDKLLINFYGNNDKEVEATISREGKLVLPMIGPVNLLGKTFQEAKDFLNNKVKAELIGTDIDLSIVDLRSINVYILGEAYKPGRYVMSGLSSVSNALFVSGGINEKGSLRNIEIKRNNKVISTYDFYDFLLRGSLQTDIALQDGDVVFIPFFEDTVTVGGAFKRPHKYEFKKGETVLDAINLAGGYSPEVLGNPIIRLSSIDTIKKVRKLEYLETDQLNLSLNNGDMINISSVSGVTPETIKLTGEFTNPGEYSIQSGDTILDIIDRAGGFSERAYFQGAIFLRESVAESQKVAYLRSADQLENTIVDVITKDTIQQVTEFTLAPISSLITRLRLEEPIGRMVVNLDVLKLKTDPFANFSVQGGDTLHLPKRPNYVSIVGEVLNSTTVGFNPQLEVDNYIELAGGLSDSADPDKIFVVFPDGRSRLVKDTYFRSNVELLPGSTIVISRDSRPFDVINITQIVTPILADLATSAAAIAALSD
jgi:protein involved in polysaccharide export with SLBB domain